MQHVSNMSRAPILLIAASVVAIGIWSSLGSVSGLGSIVNVTDSATAQCQNSADVMASLDRSRNGISLTCNSDMLLESAAL